MADTRSKTKMAHQRMAQPMRVAHTRKLVVTMTFAELSMTWARCVARGAISYADQHGWELKLGWKFFASAMLAGDDTKPPDGILADIDKPSQVRKLEKSGIPVVDITGHFPHRSMPQVCSDNRLIGRLGAEHFLERACTHETVPGME